MKGLIEIFKTLENNKCKIMYTGDTEYKITTNRTREISDLFSDNGGIQVAEAKISFSENKIQGNLLFRKQGELNVNGVGIKSFTWSNKALFVNSEINLPNLGLIVPTKNINKIERMLTRNKKNIEYVYAENAEMESEISEMTGLKDFRLIYINISNMDIIQSEKLGKNLDDTGEVYKIAELSKRLIGYKLLNKSILEVQRRAKELIPIEHQANDKLNLLTADTLNILDKTGLNVETTAFEKTQALESDEVELAKVKAVEVKIKIHSINEKGLTAKNLVDGRADVLMTQAGISENLVKEINRKLQRVKRKYDELKQNSINGDYEKSKSILKEIKSEHEDCKKVLESIKTRLWVYKLTIYSIYNNSESMVTWNDSGGKLTNSNITDMQISMTQEFIKPKLVVVV